MPRTHRRQYQLSTLFVAITVACIIGSVAVRRAYRQHDAVQSLMDSGAAVAYDFQTSDKINAPEGIWRHIGVHFVADVSQVICPHNTTDETLRWIKELENVEWVDLSGSKITDRGVWQLASLRKLAILHLNATSVGDAGVEKLRGLQMLECLGLTATRISDSGIGALVDHGRLRELYLARTMLTDGCVSDLLRLTKLKYLDLRETQITHLGLDRLRVGLPRCRILDGDIDSIFW